MARNAFAIIAGIVLAVITVSLVRTAGHSLFPAGVEAPSPDDRDAFAAYVEGLPFGSIFAVAISWWAGTLAGGILAARTGTAKPVFLAAGIAAFIFAGGVAQLVLIPHPTWFVIVSLAGILGGGALAGVVGGAIRPERPQA